MASMIPSIEIKTSNPISVAKELSSVGKDFFLEISSLDEQAMNASKKSK